MIQHLSKSGKSKEREKRKRKRGGEGRRRGARGGGGISYFLFFWFFVIPWYLITSWNIHLFTMDLILPDSILPLPLLAMIKLPLHRILDNRLRAVREAAHAQSIERTTRAPFRLSEEAAFCLPNSPSLSLFLINSHIFLWAATRSARRLPFYS